MLNIFSKINTLLIIGLLACGSILTSCDNEDDKAPNSGQVELISFGPTGVKHGDKIKFIGHNLNKVDAIEFIGSTVNKSNFIEHTPNVIWLNVPEETMAGRVVLKVSEGVDITSKSILSFDVPITVTSVTDEARPGDNITITGTKLNWLTGIVFDNDTVTTAVSQSDTEVVIQVPANAKTGKLMILGGGTDPMSIETEEELIITLPALTTLAPTTIKHSEDLTLTGTNLDLVGQVVFPGGTAVTEFVSQSLTELVVKVPNNAESGTLTLVAKGSLVEVETTNNLDIALPVITALTTVRHGEILTITGTNLDLVKEIAFTGGTKVTTFVSKTASEIKVTVPDNATNGNPMIKTVHDFEKSSEIEFVVIIPVVASFSPIMVDPGADLTINGSNLDLVKEITFVGGTKVTTFKSQSASSIVVTVPNNALSGPLKMVTHRSFEITTPALEVVLPEVTSLTPTPLAPGAYLTLNGNSLDLVKTVQFTGGAVVSSFLAQNATQLILVVPANAQTGTLKLITHRDLEVSTTQEVEIGDASGPKIKYYIYDDALNSTWQKWGGWGTTVQDMENTEHVKKGSNAIKVSYNDSYGALQLHPTNPKVFEGYTHIVLYVYGGTGNNRMALQVKTTAGVSSSEPTFNLVQGKYEVFEIAISDLGDISAGVGEFMIKNYGENPNTIYVDEMGLR